MPLSTDIELPKTQEPVFPDCCVGCRKDSPGQTVKVSTSELGWWTWLFWLPGPRHSARVPACRSCGMKLRLRRGVLLLATIALSTVLVVWLFPLAEQWVARPFRKWLVMVGAIIGLLPLVVAEIVFPPAFDMTAYKDRVDYEFRDPIYALMFAFKNKPTGEVIAALAKAGENDEGDLPDETDEPELPDPYRSPKSEW